MFIDCYGNEFKTLKDVKKYAKRNFYEDEESLANALVGYFTLDTIVDWIVTEPTVLEQFKKYFPQELKVLEEDYVEDYEYIGCSERE